MSLIYLRYCQVLMEVVRFIYSLFEVSQIFVPRFPMSEIFFWYAFLCGILTVCDNKAHWLHSPET